MHDVACEFGKNSQIHNWVYIIQKLLNDCIPGCGFGVKENAARIEERLQVNLAVKKETCWQAVIGWTEVESVDMLIGQSEMEKKT